MIEEFGKTREVGEDFDRRNRFLETAFMDAENNVLKGGAVAGTSWWNWYGRGDGRGDGKSLVVVFPLFCVCCFIRSESVLSVILIDSSLSIFSFSFIRLCDLQ